MDDMRVAALLAAVDGGSLSAAARTMGYSPAGISRLVRALEDELGATLLERGSHGVWPTALCHTIMADLREYRALGERVVERCREGADGEAGDVTLGCARSVAAHWIAPALARFNAQHPSITVRMREGATPELGRWLDEREVDLCVGTPRTDHPWTFLGESPYVVLVPADHPLAQAGSLTIDRLDREPAVQIFPSRGTDTGRIMASRGIVPDVRFTTGDIETAKAMVGAGLGCCLTVDLVGSVEGTGAVKVATRGLPPFRFGVFHRGDRTLTAAARALVETLEAHGRELATVGP